MKHKPNWLIVVGLLCLATLGTQAQAQQIASEVKFYFYPTVLPNSDNTYEFGTARDSLLTGIKFGGSSFTTSGSRVGTNLNNVTAIEIRNVFDATDILASSSTNLWRGQFNPSSPFNNQYGNRAYAPVLIIGQNGKVCLDRLSYMVGCGSMPSLGYNSSLSGLSYSVSRIGINAGPDGILFTADDQIVNSGSGTNLCDAIAFIGGRIGALADNQGQINTVNGYLNTSTWVSWSYYFTGPTNVQSGSITVPLYQGGQIPWDAQYNRLVPFIGPNGVLFSVIGHPGSPAMNLLGSRKVTGPYATVTTNATEGTSAFWFFTRNPTNDYGFYRLVTNAVVPPPAPLLVVNHASLALATKDASQPPVSSPSSEQDQDGPAVH